MSTSRTFGTSRETSTGERCRPRRHSREHALALLSFALIVPLTMQAAAPNREYVEQLAQRLSHKLPGLTGDQLTMSMQPRCRAQQVELHAVRSNVFGNATLILRCAGTGYSSLPFTATATAEFANFERADGAPLLRKGSKVQLEVTTRGLTIVTAAIALSPGGRGDFITVRATRSKRLLRAQVIDSSTVRTTLGGGEQ